jgi:hypothetical protein
MFPEIRKRLEALEGAGFAWWVAGGWAIDIFLGRITRKHGDFEIAVDRSDQALVRRHFSRWRRSKVVPGEGTVAWLGSEFLQLPVHELHVSNGPVGIEVLLNEFENGYWTFRRNTAVKLERKLFALRIAPGLMVLAPEVVLLYKAKVDRKADRLDLVNALPGMARERRRWLRRSLALAHPGHDWLGII